jgi:hypothetical protein
LALGSIHSNLQKLLFGHYVVFCTRFFSVETVLTELSGFVDKFNSGILIQCYNY